MDEIADRIIDRSGYKRPAIGIEDFESVLEMCVYVDKTLLVRDLIDRRAGGATLFCRPRRFGKSLAMRMLQCFFEAPVEGSRVPFPDRSELFEGLAISSCDDRYLRHQGAHPVIYLSLNDARGASWENLQAQIAGKMANEYDRHDYLLDSTCLSDNERAAFRRVSAQEGTDSDLALSLSKLAELLARYHGSKTVILIDEYDQPAMEGHVKGYRDEVIEFMRAWLTGALKGTTSLYLGVLTGVQRISRESIFSQLNNIVVNTALDSSFEEAFGFTADEVEALADYLGLHDKIPEMEAWYDGYCFGGTGVYNPLSVLEYLGNGGAAQPYWNNTSSNSIIHELFVRADDETAGQLADLADGLTVRQTLRLDTVFDELDRDPLAVWSQLYLAGYLTTDDVKLPNDNRLPRELRVPNQEVERLYADEFLYRALVLTGGNRARLESLHATLLAGDADAFAAEMSRILDATVSYHDTVSENSYHMLVAGLLAGVPGYRMPRSNRESGDGRPDVTLVPDAANESELPALALEVKRSDGAGADVDALASLAREALAQARALRYAIGLPGCGARIWGIAFGGKRCAAACCPVAPAGEKH